MSDEEIYESLSRATDACYAAESTGDFGTKDLILAVLELIDVVKSLVAKANECPHE